MTHRLLSALLVIAISPVPARPQVIPRSPGAPDVNEWLDEHSRGFSGAVLIGRGGDVQAAAAYGMADRKTERRNTPETRFNIGSINKTFTAVAIAQLVQQRRLSFDDTLAKHVPGYPNREAAARITIHQLLTHRSGVAAFQSTRFGDTGGTPSLADLTQTVGSAPQVFEPGTRQEYSNGGYVVLGRIVEIVSGKRYEDYVGDHIFKPAGMTATGFVAPGTSGVALGYFAAGPDGRPAMGSEAEPATENTPLLGLGNPAGGGYSTVADLFTFARALRDGRLLDAPMTQFLVLDTFSGATGPKFGYALREQPAGARRFVGNGGGAPGVNAEFRFEPKGEYVVVVLSNTSPPSATRLATAILNWLGT